MTGLRRVAVTALLVLLAPLAQANIPASEPSVADPTLAAGLQAQAQRYLEAPISFSQPPFFQPVVPPASPDVDVESLKTLDELIRELKVQELGVRLETLLHKGRSELDAPESSPGKRAEYLNRGAFRADADGTFGFEDENKAPSANTLDINRTTFTGKYYDREANLFYFHARYYDPESGRFISKDGFDYGDTSNPPSLHLYYYAMANPLRYTDPSGNYSIGEAVSDAYAAVDTAYEWVKGMDRQATGMVIAQKYGSGAAGVYDAYKSGELGLDKNLPLNVVRAYAAGQQGEQRAQAQFVQQTVADPGKTAAQLSGYTDVVEGGLQTAQAGSWEGQLAGTGRTLQGMGTMAGWALSAIGGVELATGSKLGFANKPLGMKARPGGGATVAVEAGGDAAPGQMLEAKPPAKDPAPAPPPSELKPQPQPHPLKQPQLSDKKMDALKDKVRARTATKEEWQRLESQRRLDNRRARGVDRFWAEERLRLKEGEPPTRSWSPAQDAAIRGGGRPKGVAGHHTYSVDEYPQLADDPSIIYPATPKEHIYRWHGGRYTNPGRGAPLNPSYPEEF